MIVWRRSKTERKLPRRIAAVVILANQRSTWLSQELWVEMKKRMAHDPVRTAGVVCVAQLSITRGSASLVGVSA